MSGTLTILAIKNAENEMNRYRNIIVVLGIFICGAGLSYLLLPEKVARNPAIGLGILVVLFAIVIFAGKRSKYDSSTRPSTLLRVSKSNSLLWIAILLIVLSFVWLFISLAIPASVNNPGIVFYPFMMLVSIASCLIGLRVYGWVYSAYANYDE